MEGLLLILAAVIYFVPTIVGFSKRNAGAIFVLNLFLGWTLIGWVGALVWAMTGDDDQKQTTPVNLPSYIRDEKADKFDKIEKLKSLLDSGAINESEFNSEKHKILSK